MNNKVKVALAVIAGGTLILAGLRRKKREKLKTFTAPDGNTYKENQIYRTFDNKLYKNGRPIHFETPETEPENHSSNNYYNGNTGNFSKNNLNHNKNASYHQKGSRHQ
ncbi:hypothetical protein J3D55_002466 [Chryseobacterium ginsenosidimutans]|uniref:hypothetical protein n=1 Tax=Chryseobacterium ginsenosidimutans TaxID=687846 RepID=UPI0021697515|nr:hypothetical protein [Chryseobacterium ginsenosidimutans]MCS3869550.1 hypothetical protein [Chryseobacterium ginsenosidimutans]